MVRSRSTSWPRDSRSSARMVGSRWYTRIPIVSSGGHHRVGSPWFVKRPLKDADKQAILDWRERHYSMPPTTDLANTEQWADSTQAYMNMASPVAAPDGNVWIQRLPAPSDARTAYDVVDRQGKLVAIAYLKPDERLLGFG